MICGLAASTPHTMNPILTFFRKIPKIFPPIWRYSMTSSLYIWTFVHDEETREFICHRVKMLNMALNLNQIFNLWRKIHFLFRYFRGLLLSLLRIRNPFLIQLGYFSTLSLFGFAAIKLSKPRIATTTTKPSDFDLFFTCVSSATVSSMSTVQMEYFSNTQLVFLTILMFLGGEVFTSMIGLHLRRLKMEETGRTVSKVDSHTPDSGSHIEIVISNGSEKESRFLEEEENFIKFNSLRILAIFVTCYLFLVHVAGSTLISLYFSFVSSAKEVIMQKGINMQIFSIFTAVSTFANCGFLPTNENMMVFKKNSGLLLILIPQILMGNTMFPLFLRSGIWFLDKITDRVEFKYILKNSKELGFGHLFPGLHSLFLAMTGFWFIIIQMIVFCALEWNGQSTAGLSGYEKLVAFLFQVVNSRHAGESVFDLTTISTAIIVIFIIMMYLPSYVVFLPIKEAEKLLVSSPATAERQGRKREEYFWDHTLLSQLSYLAIFIIVICITEKEKIKIDPLNFNLLNITVEVIAAYGNVGFSMGYSCEKRINPQGNCENAWYGFAGRLSNEGKFVLIVVMMFGRLKSYSLAGGRAWSVL